MKDPIIIGAVAAVILPVGLWAVLRFLPSRVDVRLTLNGLHTLRWLNWVTAAVLFAATTLSDKHRMLLPLAAGFSFASIEWDLAVRWFKRRYPAEG